MFFYLNFPILSGCIFTLFQRGQSPQIQAKFCQLNNTELDQRQAAHFEACNYPYISHTLELHSSTLAKVLLLYTIGIYLSIIHKQYLYIYNIYDRLHMYTVPYIYAYTDTYFTYICICIYIYISKYVQSRRDTIMEDSRNKKALGFLCNNLLNTITKNRHY